MHSPLCSVTGDRPHKPFPASDGNRPTGQATVREAALTAAKD
jgi:hypothetical protein